jgi:UDP-N-acetylmuramate dehydrogenase
MLIPQALSGISHLTILPNAPLSRYCRFGIGGPAGAYVETACESSFEQAMIVVRSCGVDHTVVGGGTNLIVSDAGFSGIVLRYTGSEISSDGLTVRAGAGAELQALDDYCIGHGLKGIETMTGIPGSVGGAVYGNAGAYGQSINERIHEVRFFDGHQVRTFGNAECEFRYRESIFKRHKDWIVFSAELQMDTGVPDELRKTADDILRVRLAKYPNDMKCAGSIFKNLILAELSDSVRRQIPDRVVREGKAPSAYFLEEVGAKGMRNGDIHVADYHANLIYNAGHGTARQVVTVIAELKARVEHQFGLTLEEEVQYLGPFD